METYITQLWNRYVSKIKEIEMGQLIFAERNRQAITTICGILLELRAFIHNYVFMNTVEQVKYHKHYVPEFFAEYIFYVQCQRLETATRMVTERVKHKLLEKEKRDINRFFEKNIALSQYIAGENDYLDEKYFLNKGLQLEFPFLDESSFIMEYRFITGTGYTLARLKAYGRLLKYIDGMLISKDQKETIREEAAVPALNWTESGMSLTEIAYALKYSGAVNKGNVDVKEIAEVLGRAFNTGPVNVYRNKQDLYARKNQSMFLDRLRKGLIKGLEESDNG